MMAKYRVTINRDLCIDCGIATGRCPTHARELARVLAKNLDKTSEDVSGVIFPEELYNRVKQAVECCPVKAIIIEKIEE
ncbi:MAG: ferredoxin [Candidatus Bathyarchaeia archaeon]